MKRALRFLLFGAIVLATLAALALSVVSYNSRREWAKTKADLIARGEKLSLIELAPPPIPDDQNFYADPMWLELADARPLPGVSGGGILSILQAPLSADEVGRLSKTFPKLRLPENEPRVATVVSGIPLPESPQRSTRISAAQKILNGAESDGGVLTAEAAAHGLELLEPLRPLSEDVTRLLERSSARFPILYEEWPRAKVQHLEFVLLLARFFNIRAQFELAIGDGHAASLDVESILGLARTLDHEPLLISQLVNSSIGMIAYGMIERGIALHVWSDTELVAFGNALSLRSPLKNLADALRGERGGINSIMESIQTQEPSNSLAALLNSFPRDGGSETPPNAFQREALRVLMKFYLARDQARFNNLTQTCVDEIEMRDGGKLSPTSISGLGTAVNSTPTKFLNPLSKIVFDSILSGVIRLVKEEQILRLTVVACSLERYWIANKKYPASLSDLAPQYLQQLPEGVIAGQPLEYRESGGRFLLWTAGWNETDEKGKSSPRNPESGDWVCDPWFANR